MTTIPQKTAISKAFNAGAPMIGPTIKAARQALGLTLAELTVEGVASADLSPFRIDRPALTDPAYEADWLV